MDQRGYFQLAARITGMVVCLYGLHYLWEFATLQLGYWSVERTSASMYFASAAAFIVVGLYLARGRIILSGTHTPGMKRQEMTQTSVVAI